MLDQGAFVNWPAGRTGFFPTCPRPQNDQGFSSILRAVMETGRLVSPSRLPPAEENMAELPDH